MCGFAVLGMEGGLGGAGEELGERRHLGNDAAELEKTSELFNR